MKYQFIRKKHYYLLNYLLLLTLFFAFANSSQAQAQSFKKFKNLEITCPGEAKLKNIYREESPNQGWLEPRENPATCRSSSVVQENRDSSPRNILLFNTNLDPKKSPIIISHLTVTTKDTQIIEVNCSHSSITLDKSLGVLFSITAKCKKVNYLGTDWGLVNVTLYSNTTNEAVSFYYQKLCGDDYETRFDWGYIILLTISVILVGIGSRSISTVIQNEELKVIHVFIIVAILTGCYILLYYWSEEIEFPATILFSLMSFFGATFVLNNLFKNFVSQGDCLMMKCKVIWFGKITLTNIFSILLCSGLVAAWYWKKNWIIGNVLAVCLLFTLMKLAKVTSMKVGVALLVFVICSFSLWAFVAALLERPILSFSAPFLNLPLSLTFPRLLPFPIKGTCSSVTITECVFPGLFIAFCYRYDKAKGLKLFYVAGMFGFILGMVLHATLFYTKVIILKPILFLGTCTLLCVFFVAFRRNEHKDLWDGLQSEREFAAHLLRNIDLDDEKNPKIPEFDSQIFDSIDLKKQTERVSCQFTAAATSPELVKEIRVHSYVNTD